MFKHDLLIILLLCPVHFVAGQQTGDYGVDFEFPAEPVIQDPRFSQKERQLLDAIKNDPDNPSLNIEFARLYQLHRYYDKAIAILESTIAKHPSNSRAHFCLGQILGSQQRDPNRSLTELHEAIRLKPDSIEFRQELVSVYYRLQRFPPALEHLEEILKRDPTNADALYRKAVILHIRGEIREAESIVDQLPTREHARVLKAIIVQQRGEDAKGLFESILKDAPDNIRAKYEYAKNILRERNFEEAEKIFEEIIDQEPFYQHALFQLIKIYSVKKQKEKAKLAKQSLDTINRMGRKERNFYRSYLRHHPDTAETHLAMARVYLEIARGNLAAKQFRTVLQRDPTNREALFLLGQIYMASEDYQEAVKYLGRCLPLLGDKATIHGLLAICHLHLGDGMKARSHFDAAAEIDPTHALVGRIRRMLRERVRQNDVRE